MKRAYLFIILSMILLCGCDSSRQYFPKHLEPIETHIIRFDNDIMNVRRETARQDIEILYEQYPDFMPVFVEDILGIPVSDTAYLAQQLPLFLEDTVYGFAATNSLVKQTFADVSSIEDELSLAFARCKYFFADWEVPEVYFFVSGFNSSIMFIEDGIAVGADMYLGSDYAYYNRVVYDYQRQTMRPECIATDVVSAWLFKNIPYTSRQSRLLDQMIYRGKVMYLLSVVFKEEPKYEVMGYKKEQWDWCVKYEKAIWTRIIERHDLFSTEQRLMASYLNDGPFTSEVTQDSPGRVGTWVGWRIVESYMEHHPEVSMQELMQDGDSQHILEQSYYPNR